MPRKNKATRDGAQSKVSVVEDNVSACHIEDDDTEEAASREVFQARQTLSLGSGGYRTLPQFND